MPDTPSPYGMLPRPLPVGVPRIVCCDELPPEVAEGMAAAYPDAVLFAVLNPGDAPEVVYAEGTAEYARRDAIGAHMREQEAAWRAYARQMRPRV